MKLKKPNTETFEKIKEADRDVALSRSTVFEWHKLLLEGEGSSAPIARLIVDELRISYIIIQKIIMEDLAMQNVYVKFTPKILRNDQKQ